jgi:hypothetical protein
MGSGWTGLMGRASSWTGESHENRRRVQGGSYEKALTFIFIYLFISKTNEEEGEDAPSRLINKIRRSPSLSLQFPLPGRRAGTGRLELFI